MKGVGVGVRLKEWMYPDPFAGSNTTGYVAEMLDRRWIAIEIKEEYLRDSQLRFEKSVSDQEPSGSTLSARWRTLADGPSPSQDLLTRPQHGNALATKSRRGTARIYKPIVPETSSETGASWPKARSWLS
jgi:hypothetical protein